MKKVCLSIFLISTITFASNINLSLDSHSGTGCPVGSLGAVLTEDGQTISILFDEFYAEIPQYDHNNDNHDILDFPGSASIARSSKTVSNKNCTLNFSSILKEGYKVDSVEISLDSRGATSLDPGIQARFMSQLESYSGLANFRSQVGRDHLVGRKMWRPTDGITDEDWNIHSNIIVGVNSRCALRGDHQMDFKLKSHMILMNRTQNSELAGFIALDTTDIGAGLKLKVNVSSCRGSRAQPRTNRTRTSRGSRTSGRSSRNTRVVVRR